MSNYTQKQQTEIVRDAMHLTAVIQLEKEELSRVKAERFRTAPPAPVRKVLPIPTVAPSLPPKPQVQYTFKESITEHKKSLIVLLAILGLSIVLLSILPTFLAVMSGMVVVGASWVIVIYFVRGYFRFRKEREHLNNEAAQSQEYLNAVAKAQREAEVKQVQMQKETQQEQEHLDAQYAQAKKEYETAIVPAYRNELSQWKDKQNKKIEYLEEDIAINESTLENLYETTKLISLTYRKLEILYWLYDDMRTSDHDIRYATELLDRDRQRAVTEEAGRKVKVAIRELEDTMHNDLGYVYTAIEDGNTKLDDLRGELGKMRRDMKVGFGASIYQRWGTNKELREMKEILKEGFEQ